MELLQGCDSPLGTRRCFNVEIRLKNVTAPQPNRDLTILERQRDDDGQNKLLQINGSN
jgi:hypothetical protein